MLKTMSMPGNRLFQMNSTNFVKTHGQIPSQNSNTNLLSNQKCLVEVQHAKRHLTKYWWGFMYIFDLVWIRENPKYIPTLFTQSLVFKVSKDVCCTMITS